MADQSVMDTAFAVAKGMGASDKVMLALFEAGIVESGFRNLNYGDRDSVGYLQQRPSMGWPTPMDVATATRSFVSKAIPLEGKYGTAGQLAQAVQRSAYPGKYDAAQIVARMYLMQTAGRNPSAGGGFTNVALPGVPGTENIEKVMDTLTNKGTWMRVGLMIGGAFLIMVALARATGVANAASDAAKVAVKVAV